MPSTPSKTAAAVLRDILENIGYAYDFTSGLTLSDFRANRQAFYATVRCLEIISEASRRLPSEIKDRHADIPWKAIAGAGNVFRHGYDAMRDELVWETVKNDLEALRIVVEQELQNFPK